MNENRDNDEAQVRGTPSTEKADEGNAHGSDRDSKEDEEDESENSSCSEEEGNDETERSPTDKRRTGVQDEKSTCGNLETDTGERLGPKGTGKDGGHSWRKTKGTKSKDKRKKKHNGKRKNTPRKSPGAERSDTDVRNGENMKITPTGTCTPVMDAQARKGNVPSTRKGPGKKTDDNKIDDSQKKMTEFLPLDSKTQKRLTPASSPGAKEEPSSQKQKLDNTQDDTSGRKEYVFTTRRHLKHTE